MDLHLKGKNVVVTGGSRGIGRSIALAFADEGANVALCARSEGALKTTAAEIEARGVKVFAQSCDIGDAASLDGFLDAAHAALGSVDVLVNNASGFGISDDEAGWQAGMNVDIMAAVRAGWKVVPWMEQSGGGSIVHIASISGMGAESAVPPYGAVKAALIHYGASMGVKLAPKNIRVNVVAPGSIEFPGGFWAALKEQPEPTFYERTRKGIPFKRLGAPDEVADVVVFLASRGARWITGQTVAVDGGQHLG